MSPTIDQLLEVQELDCRIVRIERELRDFPTHKAEIESRLEQHREAVEAAKKAVKEVQAQVKQLDLEIESRRQKIAKLREQQLQLKTNKEFKAMEGEVLAVEQEIAKLEDRTLDFMVKIDAANSDVKQREGELRTEEGSVKEDVLGMDGRAAELNADLAVLRTNRQAAAVGADPEWLRVYDRIFQNKKDKGLVSVENGVCSGCHMKLPPYQCHDARKRTAIVLCEYCGRMLY